MFAVALAFPDLYEIAHSHVGHKILYHMINSRPGFRAERVYAPWPDLEERLRANGRPLASLESRTPLARFGMAGFSLQYEMAHTNILNMLDLAGLPLLAADRDERFPLVAGGGPGASNPEPLADFFDLFFLGDAEASFMGDLEIVADWRRTGAPKSELFARLAGRRGVYIPSLFEPVYAGGRLVKIEPKTPGGAAPGAAAGAGSGGPVRRAAAADLENAPFPDRQISPLVKPVHDRVVVEIGRGCSRGCRFCQAGFLYRPVRERSADRVLSLIRDNLNFTGQDEAAFLSLSAGDHTQIEKMVELFMDAHSRDSVALSLPSIRAGSLRGSLARQIKRVRKTGFTIAPEAGTERLRAVVNKDLAEEDVFLAARTAFSLGWRTLKLYFMCGLPTETEEDLLSMASLAKGLKKLGRARINVGLAHFTPKPHTPFQWMPGSPPEIIKERIRTVREAMRAEGLTVRYNDPGVSFVEALLSRGDRRLGKLILEVFRSGARFEAWNDRFKLERWTDAMDRLGLDRDELIRGRSLDETLPWDHLFCGVEKSYLLRELENALAARPTPDCRQAGCLGCGACGDGVKISLASPPDKTASPDGQAGADGETEDGGRTPAGGPDEQAGPEGFGSSDAAGDTTTPGGTAPGGAAPDRGEGRPRALRPPAAPLAADCRYLARLAKDGPLVLLGHLELVEAVKRSFRRGGLRLAVSRGFHPQPKLSFLTALPLGVPSLDECLVFSLESYVPPAKIKEMLPLPKGLHLLELAALPPGKAKPRPVSCRWAVTASAPSFPGRALPGELRLSYTDPKRGPRDFRLADFVREAEPGGPLQATLTIRLGQAGTPKPLDAARVLWGLPPDQPLRLRKLRTILDTDPPESGNGFNGGV
jgi:radical SAM family uncharacterized protein/radical SAM-linked protein